VAQIKRDISSTWAQGCTREPRAFVRRVLDRHVAERRLLTEGPFCSNVGVVTRYRRGISCEGRQITASAC